MRLSVYLLILVNIVIMAVSTSTWMAGVLEWMVSNITVDLFRTQHLAVKLLSSYLT